MSSPVKLFEEKRDSIRRQIQTAAILLLENGADYEVVCVDLSNSGALLQATQTIPNHSVGVLTIYCGDDSTDDLKVEITVCRVEQRSDSDYQLGVLINKYL